MRCLAVALVAVAAAQGQSPDGFELPAGAIHRFGSRQLRHPEGITEGTVSPDGKLLATRGGYTVVVWDLQTLKARRLINIAKETASQPVNVVFSPDSNRLLVGLHPKAGYYGRRGDETAREYDLASGTVTLKLQGGPGHNSTFWYDPGGKTIGLLHSDRSVTRFDAGTGKRLSGLVLEIDTLYHPPPVSVTGKLAAIRGVDNAGLFLFSTETGKAVVSILGETVWNEALSPDGSVLVYFDGEGKVRVHDVKADKERFQFDHPDWNKPTGPMLISKDNKTLYIATAKGQLFRWDLVNKRQGPAFSNRHNYWNINAIALSPDESVLYSFSYDHLIKRWDLKTGNELPLPVGYTTKVVMTTSADGNHLILSDHEGQVDFWNLSTGKLDRQLQKPHLGGINCLAASADGKLLAAGRTSQDVRLFDVATGKVLRDIPLGKNDDTRWGDQVARIAFSADDKTVFASSWQTGVTAYDPATGEKRWRSAKPYTQHVAPVGDRLAAIDQFWGASAETELRQYDAATGRIVRETPVERELPRGRRSEFDSPPYAADLVARRSEIVTSHADGSIRWWDADTGKQLHWLKTGVPRGKALAISADGAYVAAAHEDEPVVTIFECATRRTCHVLKGIDTPATQVLFTRFGLVTSADLAPTLWSLKPATASSLDGKSDDDIWSDLATDDAVRAYRLQWALVGTPEKALKMFRHRVKAEELQVDRKAFDGRVADLESPRFAVRERAEKELTTARMRVPRAWLTKAASASDSEEGRERLARVLKARDAQPDPNEWRLRRATSVLGWIDTAEARALLKEWALD